MAGQLARLRLLFILTALIQRRAERATLVRRRCGNADAYALRAWRAPVRRARDSSSPLCVSRRLAAGQPLRGTLANCGCASPELAYQASACVPG